MMMGTDWVENPAYNQLFIFLLTKSPTPGIVMESLTGNATRFARMMLNANDPKTAVIETK